MRRVKINKLFGFQYSCRPESGMALVITLVILMLLTTTAYTLTLRVSALKRRQQFMIDYQKARYACDSALKYALADMESLRPTIRSRIDEPDFSDVFTMNQDEYRLFLASWLEGNQEQIESLQPTITQSSLDLSDTSDPNNPQITASADSLYTIEDLDEIEIPGPYGPAWPYVKKPVEFEIGPARISYTIEDENAKLPIVWALTKETKEPTATKAAVVTFFEWMQWDQPQIDDLINKIAQMAEYKRFLLNPQPIVLSTKTVATSAPKTSTSRSARLKAAAVKTKVVKTTRAANAHMTDYSRLFHSSLLDHNVLTQPLPDTGNRYEAPIKYLSLWGAGKVNINSAPRHVLEAAFTIGGQATEIADEIILRRKEKPFKSITELQTELYEYSDSIKKASSYLTVSSDFFTINVTATCGNAKTSATAAVVKTGSRIEKIAVMSY